MLSLMWGLTPARSTILKTFTASAIFGPWPSPLSTHLDLDPPILVPSSLPYMSGALLNVTGNSMDTPKNSTEGASPEVQPDDYQNEHKEASTAPTLTGHQDTDQSDITGILTQKNRTPAGPQNGEIEEGISLLQSKSDRFLKEGGKPISATAPPISPSCDVVRKKGIVVAVIKPQRWSKNTIFKIFIETKNGSGPLTRPHTRTF